MTAPVFIITIDTEGDNQWARPERVTTENARFLPRFQDVCEAYGFPPTYLVTYEMAVDQRFQEFGRSVLRRGAGEIGLHVHPWYSPPLNGPYDPRAPHLYLYELPDEVLHAKLTFLTNLLAEVFAVRPVSHRAGKWGFDERVARVLVDLGYRADCSVTPGISWRKVKGAVDGSGGPDYGGFPAAPYLLDLEDIRRAGASPLLEVPVTVRSTYPLPLERVHRRIRGGLGGKILRKVLGSPYAWLRPNGRNIEDLLQLGEWGVRRRLPVLEFMLHSSELMPGGSPTFTTAEEIERMYAHLRMLFARLVAVGVQGMTLGEYRSAWREPGPAQAEAVAAPGAARQTMTPAAWPRRRVEHRP